jgi:hypothetical protein
VTDRSAERWGRRAGAAGTGARLFPVDADRPKRIDRYIDYFGDGARGAAVTVDPCGESVLDAADGHADRRQRGDAPRTRTRRVAVLIRVDT